MYHCSKCKTLCQKHQGEWRAQCKCDIRCSPKWKPPPKPLSDKLTREFSIGKAEPEPESESIPIDNWLSMNNPKKETDKKSSKRAKATRVEATRVKATRVKATRVKAKGVHSSTAQESESSNLNKHKSKNYRRRRNKSKKKKKNTKKKK